MNCLLVIYASPLCSPDFPEQSSHLENCQRRKSTVDLKEPSSGSPNENSASITEVAYSLLRSQKWGLCLDKRILFNSLLSISSVLIELLVMKWRKIEKKKPLFLSSFNLEKIGWKMQLISKCEYTGWWILWTDNQCKGRVTLHTFSEVVNIYVNTFMIFLSFIAFHPVSLGQLIL